MRPPNAARSLYPSAAANIDLPLPPEPTSAMRVGRAAAIVRASVRNSALRPFIPRGRGGKIDGRGVSRVARLRTASVAVLEAQHALAALALPRRELVSVAAVRYVILTHHYVCVVAWYLQCRA